MTGALFWIRVVASATFFRGITEECNRKIIENQYLFCYLKSKRRKRAFLRLPERIVYFLLACNAQMRRRTARFLNRGTGLISSRGQDCEMSFYRPRYASPTCLKTGPFIHKTYSREAYAFESHDTFCKHRDIPALLISWYKNRCVSP